MILNAFMVTESDIMISHQFEAEVECFRYVLCLRHQGMIRIYTVGHYVCITKILPSRQLLTYEGWQTNQM